MQRCPDGRFDFTQVQCMVHCNTYVSRLFRLGRSSLLSRVCIISVLLIPSTLMFLHMPPLESDLCLLLSSWLGNGDSEFPGIYISTLFFALTVFVELEESARFTCSCVCWIWVGRTIFCNKNNSWMWVCINISESRSWDPFCICCTRKRRKGTWAYYGVEFSNNFVWLYQAFIYRNDQYIVHFYENRWVMSCVFFFFFIFFFIINLSGNCLTSRWSWGSL